MLSGMNLLETFPCQLHNFEGPLDYLLYLIQKREIDIYDVPINRLLEQFSQKERDFDLSSEFVSVAATLLWLKSKQLLPQNLEVQDLNIAEDIDPRFEIIHHVVDYCRFKKAAEALTSREKAQSAHFFRGEAAKPPKNLPLGLEEIALEDLANIFQQILTRSGITHGTVEGERWLLADAILTLSCRLSVEKEIPFINIFSQAVCRDEMIVLFLAILEMMKNGTIQVVYDTNHEAVVCHVA